MALEFVSADDDVKAVADISPDSVPNHLLQLSLSQCPICTVVAEWTMPDFGVCELEGSLVNFMAQKKKQEKSHRLFPC